MNRFMSMVILAIVAVVVVQCAVAQTEHVVGDSLGWNIPPNAQTYTTWASTKTFVVGDNLGMSLSLSLFASNPSYYLTMPNKFV